MTAKVSASKSCFFMDVLYQIRNDWVIQSFRIMMRFMSPRACLLWRGFAAVILALGYYAIGFAVSGGLLYLAYRLSLIHNEYGQILFLIASYIGSIIFI